MKVKWELCVGRTVCPCACLKTADLMQSLHFYYKKGLQLITKNQIYLESDANGLNRIAKGKTLFCLAS